MWRSIAIGSLLLIWVAITDAQIQNPGFENDANWDSVGGRTELPFAKADYDKKCKKTGNRGGRVGMEPGPGGSPGQNFGELRQEFTCPGQSLYCTVTFNAKFTLAAGSGESAVVTIKNLMTGWETSGEIPASDGFKKYRISNLGCRANVIIRFLVSRGAVDKVQSTLCVDDLASNCDADDQTNMGADVDQLQGVLVFPGLISLPPECADGALAFEDCNCNGEDDFLEIAVGEAGDKNSNAVPDECEATQCPWDIDEDGIVGIADFLAVLAHWGPCQ